MDCSYQLETVSVENGNAERRGQEAAGVRLEAPSLLVSTALGLASDEKQRLRRPEQFDAFVSSSSVSSSSLSLFAEEVAASINLQKKEMESFLLAQREQPRRSMAERLRVHLQAFQSAVGESAARRVRAKDEEVERLERRRSELEDCVGRLQAESMAWQTKATADQRTIAALSAQLQQLAAAAPSPRIADDGSRRTQAAEDAESVYGEPDRSDRDPACRSCGWRRATVVLFPCRHLCICDACGAGADSCPLCGGSASGIVRVFFS